MSSGDTPPSLTHDQASEWRPRFNPWLVAFSVMPATFMEVLDTSVANVALPRIAGMATFLDRWTQSHQAVLVSHLTPYDPAYHQWLNTAQAGLKTQVGEIAAGPKALGLLYRVLGQQARLLAYMDNFRVVSYLTLLAVPLVLLFKKPKARKVPAAH